MKKKKKKSKVVKKILFLIIILLIICLGIFGYKTHVNGGGVQGLLATLVGNDRETLEELEPIQFLLLGVSTDLGGKITDTIMVATYNPKDQTASLLSIPRDTYTGKDHSQGTPNEKVFEQVSASDLHTYIKAGHFPAKTTFPKVDASIRFVTADSERKAVISNLDKAKSSLAGKTGTTITA